MTASQLIAEIFSRESRSVPLHLQADAQSEVRIVSTRQAIWLRDLITIEASAGAGETVHGDNGSLVWRPAGGYKYILTYARIGEKHTITRLRNLGTCGAGSLFPEMEAAGRQA